MRCAWCSQMARHRAAERFLVPRCPRSACVYATHALTAEMKQMRSRFLESTPFPSVDDSDAIESLALAAARCADLDGPANTTGWVLF